MLQTNHFPTCGYIIDATVQQINQPGLEWEEASKYFSRKHSIYCLKSKVIVTLNGLAVHIVTAVKGLIHDKTIFGESIDDFNQSVVAYHQYDPYQIIADNVNINTPKLELFLSDLRFFILFLF